MMEQNETILLLRKFIKNQCSANELEAITRLIQEGIDESLWQQVLLEEQIAFEYGNDIILKPAHSDRLYASIEQRMKTVTKPVDAKANGFTFAIRWLSAAAALLILGYFIIPRLASEEVENNLVLLEASTHTMERRQVKTEDGSEIWINNQSRLRYPQKFKSTLREVFLEGEAFFEVKKDTHKPFIVTTQDVTVKVLGTSFNVKSFDEEKEIRITLATGKVEVETVQGNKIELAPGEQLIYNKDNKSFTKQNVKVDDSFAWRDGLLVFNSAPLKDIAAVLERWYGVNISIAGEQLKQKRITLKQRDKNLRDVLEVLAFSGGLNYTMKGDEVTIMNKQE